MKNLLIAASILAMTAGVASADITFSGTAKAGVATNGTGVNPNGTDTGLPNTDTSTADETWAVYSSFNLAVTASGQTDSGLSFGATFDMTSGTSYDLADDDGFNVEGGSFGTPDVFVSGSFGRIDFKRDGFDFADGDASDEYVDVGGNTDGDAVDVKYAGTFGGFAVGLAADVDSGAMGVSLGYTMGALALGADYQQNVVAANNDLWNVSVGYTMGAFTATVTAGNEETTTDTNETVKIAYSANGISASAKYNTSDDSIDLAAGYSSGPIAVNVSDNTVSGEWTVTGSYDLGGGLSLEAGANYSGDAMIGAKMAF